MAIQACPRLVQCAKKFLVVLAVSSPLPLSAGGYGDAGVSDDNVAQYAPGRTFWCPEVEAEVPLRLYRQLNCGEGAAGTARGVVAGERITNERSGGLLGFFSGLRHERQPKDHSYSNDDDDDRPTPTRAARPDDRPEPGRPPASSVDKWERLGELGVNGDNFDDQSREFRERVSDYRKTHGTDGDWSGFNPD